MGQNLFRELDIGFGPAGGRVIEEDGLSVAGRFGQANIARNDGFEDLVSEELPEIGGDEFSEVGAVVEHGEKDSFGFQGVAEGFADAVDGIEEFGDSFESEEFALDGDKDGVGCHEGVEGEEVECGWAIDQDIGVAVANAAEGILQELLAVVYGYDFQVSSDEVFVGWQEVEAFHFCLDDGVFGRCSADEDVVSGGFVEGLFDSKAGGGVALGVCVYQEYADVIRGEGCCEVDRGGGFTDSAFLVGDCDYTAQVGNRSRVPQVGLQMSKKNCST